MTIDKQIQDAVWEELNKNRPIGVKPTMETKPAWANYLAMDRDTHWVWYAEEPIWDEKEGIWVLGKNKSSRFLRCDRAEWPQHSLKRLTDE